jgi:3-dehydroquinate dehydratase-1
MPQSAQDVLRLLAFTLRAAQEAPGPVISMAMGKLGAISRLSGETLGSAMTFGSAGAGSAPGQMDAGTLRAALEALHGA